MKSTIVLELLDAAHARPLQSWSFPGSGPITVGRADDNDVTLSDPFVSRAHARLEQSNGRWRAIAVSEQQFMCAGERLGEIPLEDGVVFQLGPRGCALRFSLSKKSGGNNSTITFDPTTMPIFQLDSAKLQREVEEISSSDCFRQLQQEAQRLRQRQQQL